ncbi:MAG: DUF2846 domain-containing protein [Pseudomonadota bacterium]
MTPSLRIALAVASLALAAPLAAAAQDAEAPAPAPAEAPAAPADPAVPAASPVAADGTVAAPPAGKGQIVFFRKSALAGAAISFKVRENDVELGKLSVGRYFVVPVEPGEHTYIVHSEAKDILTFEVEAGETYFVEGTITVGIIAGRPNLTPSSEAAFKAAFPKMKPAAK